jgi:hypothetical protein
MTRPSAAGQGFETLHVSDFELVRNAKGEWLCIVPCAPAAFLDNPMHTLGAHLAQGALIIQSPAARLQLHNILSSQYLSALETDKPNTLFLSVVDDDGTKQFSARVPLTW